MKTKGLSIGTGLFCFVSMYHFLNKGVLILAIFEGFLGIINFWFAFLENEERIKVKFKRAMKGCLKNE